jgi:hypothetical protein
VLDGDHKARDVLDAHGAAARFTRAELIAACQAALDEDFSLETLRDQLAFAQRIRTRLSPVTVPGRSSSPR